MAEHYTYLLGLIGEKTKRIAELEAALGKYGFHKLSKCQATGPCLCGWDDVRRKLLEGTPEGGAEEKG